MTERLHIREGTGRAALRGLGRELGWKVRRDVAPGEYNHGVIVWEAGGGEEVRYVEDGGLYARYLEGSPGALEPARGRVPTWTRAELLAESLGGSVVATLRLGAMCEAGEDAEVVEALEVALGHSDVGVRRAALVVIEELGWPALDAALQRAATDEVWGGLVARLIEARGGGA